MQKFIVWVVLLGVCGWSKEALADVFFSHMIEGSSSNKAIAVYNGNDTAIDLNDYEISRYNNGSLVPTDTFDFTTDGFTTLLPGEVFVVANPAANPAILAQANFTHSITFYNGDDAIALLENGVVIDSIGEIGVDPGSGWPVGAGATNNFSLSRMKSICTGQTDWNVGATEWDVYPIDTADGLNHFLPDCQSVNLFISEYADGPGTNQAIELYNAGPHSVRADTIHLVVGGSGTVAFSAHVSGYLQAGQLLVVSNPNADDSELVNNTDFTDPALAFDGNDSVHIVLSPFLGTQGIRNFVDQFGIVGNDPGPGGWPVSGGNTNDSVLIRQKQVCQGDADWSVNAEQWQTYFNDYFGDIGSHTIRDCSQPAPNLVWTWSFDTESGWFLTDGTVADASGSFDFDIYQIKAQSSVLPSMLDEQFIEFQPFQGFNWDGSEPTQFYRSSGAFTNGSTFFTLTGPAYIFNSGTDGSSLISSPDRSQGTLAQGTLNLQLDTLFINGFD